MHRAKWQPRHLEVSNVLNKAAQKLEKYEKLPRWLSQTIAVLTLLAISGLFLNGGALLAANFMHVLIGKVDMPPSIVYHMPTMHQTTAPQHVAGTKVNSTPDTKHNVTSNAISNHRLPSTYVFVPRPTFASAMDKLLIRMHNPADGYIQSDAVDAGVLLQQTLHQMLSSIFSDATRTSLKQTQIPPGIPLNQGQ